MLSVIFDERSLCWDKCKESNCLFLESTRQYLIYREQSQGYLFLNEALDMLGLKRCKDGYKLGWHLVKGQINLHSSIFGTMIDPDNPDKIIIKFLDLHDITKVFEEACDE